MALKWKMAVRYSTRKLNLKHDFAWKMLGMSNEYWLTRLLLAICLEILPLPFLSFSASSFSLVVIWLWFDCGLLVYRAVYSCKRGKTKFCHNKGLFFDDGARKCSCTLKSKRMQLSNGKWRVTSVHYQALSNTFSMTESYLSCKPTPKIYFLKVWAT